MQHCTTHCCSHLWSWVVHGCEFHPWSSGVLRLSTKPKLPSFWTIYWTMWWKSIHTRIFGLPTRHQPSQSTLRMCTCSMKRISITPNLQLSKKTRLNREMVWLMPNRRGVKLRQHGFHRMPSIPLYLNVTYWTWPILSSGWIWIIHWVYSSHSHKYHQNTWQRTMHSTLRCCFKDGNQCHIWCMVLCGPLDLHITMITMRCMWWCVLDTTHHTGCNDIETMLSNVYHCMHPSKF